MHSTMSDREVDTMVCLHMESFDYMSDPQRKPLVKKGSSNSNCVSAASTMSINYIPGKESISSALQNQNVKGAVEMIIKVYRAFGSSSCAEIRTFVDVFCDSTIQTPTLSKNHNHGYFSNVDVLSCPICFGILVEPVTVQCGHSYCRRCLEEETVGSSCKRCRIPFSSTDVLRGKLNVLLGSLIEKWWFKDLEAASHRNEGNVLFDTKQGLYSLSKYSQALDLTSKDHLTLGNKSHVLLTLGRSEEALADIDVAIKNCPLWGKGYFRKSCILISLGRYEEAFINLTYCVCLMKAAKSEGDAGIAPVKIEMVKVLHKIFAQAAGALGNRRHSFDQLQLSPYPKSTKVQNDIDPFIKMSQSEIEGEYSSSGEESVVPGHDLRDSRKHSCVPYSKPTSYKQIKFKKSVNSLNDNQLSHDMQVSRIVRLIKRSIHEITRIQREVMNPKTKGSTDADRCPIISPPIDSSQVSSSDVECTLCYRLLYQPVTTFCGHTFCRVCLERSLDHSPACPLCKTSLNDYLVHRRHAITQFVEIAISQFLPTEYSERSQQHREEIAETASLGRNSTAEIPIFVCTMAFPTIPCPLHVFEPRYRLMIRRCVESGVKRFGMCCYLQDGENSYADCGTLLEIRNVQYFADGRSVVDTIGKRRFKVLSKSQKDGYNTACVEIVEDRAIDDESLPHVQEIHNKVYSEAQDWLQSINQVLQQRIYTHFGHMPTPESNWEETSDGPGWTWWLLAILPLDSKAQLAILSMNSLQKRLESIQKVLKYVKTSEM